MAKHLRRPSTHQRVSRALVVPVAVLAAVAATVPAFAAKGAGSGATSGSTGSSLSVVVETGPDQVPNYGETITFNVTSPVDKKWVDLLCSQNGKQVYSQTAGFFPDYPWAPDYTLSSAYWTGGAAQCNARLYTTNSRGKQSTLATLAFTVQA